MALTDKEKQIVRKIIENNHGNVGIVEKLSNLSDKEIRIEIKQYCEQRLLEIFNTINFLGQEKELLEIVTKEIGD